MDNIIHGSRIALTSLVWLWHGVLWWSKLIWECPRRICDSDSGISAVLSPLWGFSWHVYVCALCPIQWWLITMEVNTDGLHIYGNAGLGWIFHFNTQHQYLVFTIHLVSAQPSPAQPSQPSPAQPSAAQHNSKLNAYISHPGAASTLSWAELQWWI